MGQEEKSSARPHDHPLSSARRHFFSVDEYVVSHELYSGVMSKPLRRLVFERGDSVAALLYDVERRKMILVEQFRMPAHSSGKHQGWMIEAVAGMIRERETPEMALVREVEEETGYKLRDFRHVSTFFSSPGGSSERVHLYFAEVLKPDKVSPGGGIGAIEGDVEDIRIIELDAREFYRRIHAQEFEDPKIIIAGQWFEGEFSRLQTELERGNSRTIAFRHATLPDRRLGIKTGDILVSRASELSGVWSKRDVR